MAKKPMPKPPTRAIMNTADFPGHLTHGAVSLLKKFGITTGLYFDPEFPVDKMHSGRSMTAQVRKEEYVAEHLDRITAAMKDDPADEWPAVLLWWDGSFYINLDGNHRRKGATDANLATLPAVVVDLPKSGAASLANQIAVKANRKHGLLLSNEESLMSGATMITDEGFSVAKAARVVEVPESTLRKFVERFKVEKRAINGGIRSDVLALIPPSTLAHFDRIGNNVPFLEAIALAAESKMEGALVSVFVKEIEQRRDYEEQRNYIADVRADMEAQAAKKAADKAAGALAPSMSHSTKRLRALTLAINGIESTTMLDSLTSVAAIEEAAEALDADIIRLRNIQRRLRKLATATTATRAATAASRATTKTSRTSRAAGAKTATSRPVARGKAAA